MRSRAAIQASVIVVSCRSRRAMRTLSGSPFTDLAAALVVLAKQPELEYGYTLYEFNPAFPPTSFWDARVFRAGVFGEH